MKLCCAQIKENFFFRAAQISLNRNVLHFRCFIIQHSFSTFNHVKTHVKCGERVKKAIFYPPLNVSVNFPGKHFQFQFRIQLQLTRIPNLVPVPRMRNLQPERARESTMITRLFKNCVAKSVG